MQDLTPWHEQIEKIHKLDVDHINADQLHRFIDDQNEELEILRESSKLKQCYIEKLEYENEQLKSDCETLRAENVQLKLNEAHLKLDIHRLEALNRSFDENEKRLLVIVRNLRSEKGALLAEREQWMKQEPVAHRARDIQGNWVYRDGPFRYAPFEKLYKHPLPASSCA